MDWRAQLWTSEEYSATRYRSQEHVLEITKGTHRSAGARVARLQQCATPVNEVPLACLTVQATAVAVAPGVKRDRDMPNRPKLLRSQQQQGHDCVSSLAVISG